MRAFADALDAVPMALAENSGLQPIETLANIKSRQAKEKNTRLGVDCMQTGSNGKSTLSNPLVSLVHTYLRFPFPHRLHSFCATHGTPLHRVEVQSRGASAGCSAVPPRLTTNAASR